MTTEKTLIMWKNGGREFDAEDKMSLKELGEIHPMLDGHTEVRIQIGTVVYELKAKVILKPSTLIEQLERMERLGYVVMHANETATERRIINMRFEE